MAGLPLLAAWPTEHARYEDAKRTLAINLAGSTLASLEEKVATLETWEAEQYMSALGAP